MKVIFEFMQCAIYHYETTLHKLNNSHKELFEQK